MGLMHRVIVVPRSARAGGKGPVGCGSSGGPFASIGLWDMMTSPISGVPWSTRSTCSTTRFQPLGAGLPASRLTQSRWRHNYGMLKAHC